ncbi:thioesterase II family protein [Nocardia transvalensis]|uniref:thioesterase II family protein n=1 Tax=Nocardia transvalensis TaxID=37333 RepID=UPI001895B4C3|nr:alpha/beta fold hydrolase [Nocardia transvalensis]MBF6330373.1 thioesterase [Nocardia transvalensis]
MTADTVRLLCLPHAGGTASAYHGWHTELGPDVTVVAAELPGRDGRRAEPPLTDVHRLAEDLAGRLAGGTDQPYALFGHSFGAIVAFEIARLLARDRAGQPRRLFVSASPAPDDQDIPDEPLHRLPDDQFIARLAELGAIPRRAVDDAELSAVLLPQLRADWTAAETYVFAPDDPLSCPISVLGGQQDPMVGTDHLDGWRRHTTGETVVRVFPGAHFFLADNRTLIARAVRKDLSGATGR